MWLSNIVIIACGILFKVQSVHNFVSAKINSDLVTEAFMDSFELLVKYGYSPERISITTEDGYIIEMFHIPRKGPPVLLVHGITDSSDGWLVLGPERSLACQLAKAGFDVWLLNNRGNRYSKGYRGNISGKEYWNFTYEEMGVFDLPAAIDHILNVTSRKKLTYIGFSLGTTVFFVMCSMKPEYNDKIETSIHLAPVAWIGHIKLPFIDVVSHIVGLLHSFTNALGIYELLPFTLSKVYRNISCLLLNAISVCNPEYNILFGLPNATHMSPDRIIVIDGHLPAGVSVLTLVHFVQGYSSKRFQRYDYGPEKNLQIYSSKQPPLYNLSLVTAPVNIFASEIDWYSDVTDLQILKNKLPNIERFTMLNKSLEFSHLEFMYGTRAQKLINDPVLNILLEIISVDLF